MPPTTHPYSPRQGRNSPPATKPKRLLWLSWKDRHHPLAGGAEVVTDQLLTRLAADGWEVMLLTARYQGSGPEQSLHGYRIIRRGNRLTVYWQAFRYYRQHLLNWPDIVVDEMNTIPFLAKWYVKQPHLLFAHMLCREIWLHQMRFPFSWLGFLLEPLYLKLLYRQPVITISQSTKDDLIKFGFSPSDIHIISEGIELEPVKVLTAKAWQEASSVQFQASRDKNIGSKAARVQGSKNIKTTHHSPLSAPPGAEPATHQPTLLLLGSLRKMKQPDQIVKAFEIAKLSIPSLRLEVAGAADDAYGQQVVRSLKTSPNSADIVYHGRVSENQKLQLMRDCHVICVASLKEGWGLIVTEANSQGTPAIAYNADGLRDSVRHQQTGLLTVATTPEAMAEQIVWLFNHPSQYQAMRQAAWQWSKQITFDRSYAQFKQIIAQPLYSFKQSKKLKF